VRRRWDLRAAVVDYELERQPLVERTQAAASESAAYFRRVASYTHLEPVQFAFNLLTRSGRISHASLSIRDPDFTRALDSWFGGTAVAPPPLFAPLELRGVRFPDRVGLALSGFVAVSGAGRITPDTPTIDEWAPPRSTAPVVLQLGHAGRRGACRPAALGIDVPLRDGWPLVSAAPLRYGPYSAVPGVLDDAGRAEVLASFVRAAERAAGLGVDVLELDLAHGYLLGSFLSPLSNPEGDRAFPFEVVAAVRATWPRVLAARISVTDWHPKGNSVEDGIGVARNLREAGVDLIHVEAGQTVHDDRPEYRRGFLTALSDRVRNEARIATLVRGHLTTADEANTIVGAGRADLCLLDLPPASVDSGPLEPSNRLLLAEETV
jgi:anthraniloyl-CoA monooxygenase